jgi:hypothetical protein
MKKLVLVLGLVALTVSCNKEIVTPNNPQNEICNCGLIVSDNVSDYSVTIRNSCTDNLKTFYLLPGDWMNAYVGDNYCITNVTGW